MEFREFTGKTVEDATIEAATTLGIASSELDIEVVSKGTSGFLGIGAKPAVIRARAKKEVNDDIEDILANVKKPGSKGKKNTPKKQPVNKTSEVKEEKPVKEVKEVNEEVKDEDTSFETEEKKAEPKEFVKIEESVIEETRQYLEKLFAAMEMEADIDITVDDQTRTMNIDVEGPEMGIIIGKRGQTLDSLQYLISLFVNKKSDSYIRIKLDTENYRERRRETLENLAKNIAYKVKKSRRSFSLEPMNPYERRIIHSTLQNDKYVTTKSEGEEPYRKVVVYPNGGKKRYNK
ncbi:MAG: protein jag [Eubacterium sp.]|nr:protein jag [Eubacterium sp.]